MKIPHGLARAVSVVLLAQMVLAPVARALGPLTPANLQVTRGAPTLDDREGTLDYPVTFTNATGQAIAGPIQVFTPSGTLNYTLFTNDPGQPQTFYVTLPTALAPGQSFTQIFRIPPSRLGSPVFTPFVETIGPVDPATAPAPQITNARPGEYVVQSDYPLRIRAIAGQEYLWDADATNPNGGTLDFTLGPIPNPKPDLAAASPVTDATLDPLTGVLRWTPPAPGLYTARLNIADGKANATGFIDLAFQVEDANALPPALSCNSYITYASQPGQERPLFYDFRRYDDLLYLGGNPQNVVVGPGRTAACTPNQGTTVGEGSYDVHCQTTDALYPVGSCDFPASVTPSYGFVVVDVQDFVNLRLTAEGCAQVTDALTPCSLPGTNDLTVRNTGLGVAHDVVLTIPIPPEANSGAIAVVTSGPTSLCQRVANGADVSLVCAFGDLAGGAEQRVAWVLSPNDESALLAQYSPVTVSVATSTPELTYADNSVLSQPTIKVDYGVELEHIYTCAFPDGQCHCDGVAPQSNTPLPASCSAKIDQAWADLWAEQRCREAHAHDGTFAVLLGDACAKKPAWFQYVINGIFAVGAIITGAGVFLEAIYGAANISIFTADIIPAAAYPIN
jgi:hypothetical protein